MASKIKNIYHKKTLIFFYPEDGFYPKKLHGLSEEPNPCTFHPRTEESLELEKNELEEGEYRGAVVTQAQP